jgi:cell division septation protein DedD
MHGPFDEEEFEPAEQKSDTVFTLGPMMGLGLFLGLAVLCGVFFAFGYAVGHRAPQSASTASNDAVEKLKPATVDVTKTKPAPTGQSNSANTQSVSVAQPSNQYAQTPPEQFAQTSQSKDGTAGPAYANPKEHAAQPAGASNGWMVQIAAVSHQEDAEVLEGALRKRGYAVTLNRDAADNLIHVRIGPFTSRDEATQWRQKLLSDGYNAMLQP